MTERGKVIAIHADSVEIETEGIIFHGVDDSRIFLFDPPRQRLREEQVQEQEALTGMRDLTEGE